MRIRTHLPRMIEVTARRIAGPTCLFLMLAQPALAQEEAPPPIPCQEYTCGVWVDWQGQDAFRSDRRYGSPQAFEPAVLQQLALAGYRVQRTAAPAAGLPTLKLLPRLTQAYCDRVAGTSSSRNCAAIGEVRVELLDFDPDLDVDRTLTIRGRCGGDQLMEISQVSQFVALTIDYEFHDGEGRDRPSRRCVR